ncbi:hypothetical protein JOD24_001115 [Kroppenstedtia sanguinis]
MLPQKLMDVFGGKDFRFTYSDGNRVEYLIIMYECTVESGTLQAMDGESVRYINPTFRPKLTIPYPEEIFYQRTDSRQ